VNKYKIIVFGLLLCLISCDDRKLYFDKTFEGLWAETFWTYEFKSDGTFKFITNGHYSDSEYSGDYIIKDSLIFLDADTDWPVLDGVLKTRLSIISENCLRDFDNNYYCVTIDSMNDFISKQYEFNERVIKLIDELEEVRDEKRRISTYDNGDHYKFRIKYDGIIVIDKREYHCFNFNQATFEDSRTFLTFLVTENPFEIYQHDNAGNKLTKVYHE
jgi:gamma-glutamylcyclotransferase (GGCT)/AIG2-like uncharacterized protein YtfP